MLGDGKQFKPQEMGTLGMGVVGSAIAAVLASANQLPWLLIIPISFGVGVVTWLGADQIRQAIGEMRIVAHIRAEYLDGLTAIGQIASRIRTISQSACLQTEIAGQIEEVARILLRILLRFEERQIINWASATLLIVERFIPMLEEYHAIQCGELFVRDEIGKRKIADIERRVLPMLTTTLYEIGIRLDEGRFQTDILLATMEDIAKSLGLLDSLKKQLGEPPQKEESHE